MTSATYNTDTYKSIIIYIAVITSDWLPTTAYNPQEEDNRLKASSEAVYYNKQTEQWDEMAIKCYTINI